MEKYNFSNLAKDFNTESKCLQYIMERKYKGNICPACGKKTKFYKVKRTRFDFDTGCQHRFSFLADTPLRRNRTPLTTIFHIVFLLAIAKNGLSAMEVQRHFGMTYKTAWALLKKIRSMLKNNDFLSGVVEKKSKEEETSNVHQEFMNLLKQMFPEPTH